MLRLDELVRVRPLPGAARAEFEREALLGVDDAVQVAECLRLLDGRCEVAVHERVAAFVLALDPHLRRLLVGNEPTRARARFIRDGARARVALPRTH